MADVTDISGIPYPLLEDAPDIEEAVKPLAEHIDNMVVSRFATTSERDGAVTSPVGGQVCYVGSHGLQLYGNAPGWVPFPGTEVCTLRRNTAQSIANNTDVAISFNDQAYLPWGGHSVSVTPTRITLPFPGRYMLYYGAGYATVGGTDTPNSVTIRKNGTELTSSHCQVLADGNLATKGNVPVSMDGSSDYLELYVLQVSGGTLNTSTSFRAYPYLTAIFSGPAYI